MVRGCYSNLNAVCVAYGFINFFLVGTAETTTTQNTFLDDDCGDARADRAAGAYTSGWVP